MSTQLPPDIEFAGLLSVWLLIYSLWLTMPKDVKSDLYKRITQAIWNTKKDKLEEELLKNEVDEKKIEIEKKKIEIELLKADVLKKNAEALQECRNVGVDPADNVPLGIEKEKLPQVFQAEGPDKLAQTIEEQKGDIINRSPRVDYLKAVLLLRQEGLITNKLGDKALANLLEIIMDKDIQDYQSMSKETGDFEVDIKKVERVEDKKKG